MTGPVGATFFGWLADTDGTIYSPGVSYFVTGPVTFTAQWQNNSTPPPSGGNLNIIVGFNLGVKITGSNGANVIRRSRSESLTLSATGYDSVTWYVDGGSGINGDTLTISASDHAYDVQIHSVTFTGYKNGTPYSQAIPFTVLD
jgi:hypothetical protein